MIWVDGDTSPRPFVLRENGQPVDLVGKTVSLLMRSTKGALSIVTSGIEITPAIPGGLTLTPTDSMLSVDLSPYSVRWRVTDGSTVRLFPFPNPDRWDVQE